MTHSESINEIATALAKAQGEMKNPSSEAVNSFQKYKYAKLTEYLNIIRPALTKHGIAFNQDIETTENRKEIVLLLSHTSGQWIKFKMPLEAATTNNKGISFDQAWGAHITYRQKNLIRIVFGIHNGEDDDGESTVTQTQEAPQSQRTTVKKNYEKVTSEQVQNIMFEIGQYTEIADRLLNNFNIDRLSELPKQHYLKIIEKIRHEVSRNRSSK